MALSFHDFTQTHLCLSHITHTDGPTSHQKRFCTLSYACGRIRYLQGLSYFAKCVLITLIQQRPSPHPRADGCQQSLMGSVPVPRVLWVLQTGGPSQPGRGRYTG